MQRYIGRQSGTEGTHAPCPSARAIASGRDSVGSSPRNTSLRPFRQSHLPAAMTEREISGSLELVLEALLVGPLVGQTPTRAAAAERVMRAMLTRKGPAVSIKCV